MSDESGTALLERLRQTWLDCKAEALQRDRDCEAALAHYKEMCEERERSRRACEEAADALNSAVDKWIGLEP